MERGISAGIRSHKSWKRHEETALWKKAGLDWQCGKAWILFGYWLTVIMTVLITLNWRNLSAELKTAAAIAALIPIHIVEEAEFYYSRETKIPGCFMF